MKIEEIKMTGDNMSGEKLQTSRWMKIVGDFFREMANRCDEYDYVFLTSRRCFCLYDCFVRTNDGITEDAKEKLKQKVYSSQSIDILGGQRRLNGKKVLLCDDIMLHGQSVYKVYEKVKKYKAEIIDTLIMVRKIELPDYYRYKIGDKPRYHCITMQGEAEWRNYSNLIVKYIFEMGGLYTSYVYAFKHTNSVADGIIEELLSKNVVTKLDYNFGVKVNFFENINEPEYYIIEDVKSLFGNNYKFSCIEYMVLKRYRIYDSDESWIVPYVEFKGINIESLLKLFEEISSLNSEFSCISNSNDMYKALTVIFSYFVFRKLFGSSTEIEISNHIDRSYFDSFFENIKTISEKDFLKGIDDLAFFDGITEFKGTLMEAGLPKLKGSAELYDKMKHYFIDIEQKEENEYKSLAEKTVRSYGGCDFVGGSVAFEPIRAISFYRAFIDDDINCVYKCMLYFMDTGVVSHVIRTFDVGQEQYVGTFIKNSEQSYRLFADIAGNHLRPINFLLIFAEYYTESKESFLNEFMQKIKCYDGVSGISVEIFEFFLKIKFIDFRHYYLAVENLLPNTNEEESQIYDLVCDVVKEITSKNKIKRRTYGVKKY